MTLASHTDSEKATWFHPEELKESHVLVEIYERRYSRNSAHFYMRHFNAAHRKVPSIVSVIRMNQFVEDVMIARMRGEVVFE